MNYTLGLFIIGFIISIFSLFREFQNKKLDLRSKRVIITWIVLLTLQVMFGFIAYSEAQKASSYEKYIGSITGALDTSSVLKISCGNSGFHFSQIEKNQEKIFIGGNNNSNLFIIGGFDEDKVIVGKNEKGTPYMSITIRDNQGNIIVNVKKNEWTINPNLILDKNFDTNGFEVIDTKGKVVLQISIEKESINLALDTYTKIGNRVQFKPETNGGCIFSTSNDSIELIPIFEYPSSLHQAQRIR